MSFQDTFNVAVTGNAPFMEYDYNTSALVRDALPEFIKRPGKKEIRILKHYRDTRDTYDDVRRVSKEIYVGDRFIFLPKPQQGDEAKRVRIDLILHLGMVALGWRPDQFRFEIVARRDVYELAGDDGRHVDSEELKSLGLPATLATSLDVEAAGRKVMEKFSDTPIFVSDDAGHYFCEFQLYSSLAEPFVTEEFRKMQGRTVFEHLPQDHSTETIDLAQDVTASYIMSLADDPLFDGDRLRL